MTVVPFLHITTRIEGRKDEGLLSEKGGRGFPHIVFMDETGGVVAVQGDRSVAGFQKTLAESVQQFLDLRAKAQSGDAAAQIEFALLEGDLGRIPFADLQNRLKGKKLSDAQKVRVGDIELGTLIAEVDKAREDAARGAAMKSVADAYAAGRLPSGSERKMEFLGIVLRHGLVTEDPDLAQKAIDTLKPLYEEAYGKDNPKLQQHLQQVSDKIAELRDAKAGGCGSDEGIEEGCGEESEGSK